MPVKKDSEKRTPVRALMSGTHSRSSPPDPHIVFAQVRTAARPCSLEEKKKKKKLRSDDASASSGGARRLNLTPDDHVLLSAISTSRFG